MKQVIGNVAFIRENQFQVIDYSVNQEFAFLDDRQQEKEWIEKMKEDTVIIKQVCDVYSDGKISECNCLKIFIPVKVSENMVKKTLEYCEKLKETEKIRDIYLTNYRDSSFGIDYDYYDYEQNMVITGENKEELNKKREPFSILNYFFKEKLGVLNDFEKEMFYHYRNFDLEQLLFSNDYYDYPLNHGNLGVISIFPERIYCSNCTKMQHGDEMNKHLRLQGFDLGDSDLLTMVMESNSIQIQICKSSIIVWIPQFEKLSDYQREQIESFGLFVEELVNKRNEDINFLFGVISDMELDEREGIENFNDWISLEKVNRSR